MRFLVLAVILLTSAASASVITNTTCFAGFASPFGGPFPDVSDAGPTQCSAILTDPSGQLHLARAIAAATVSTPSSPTRFFTVSTNQSVLANGGGGTLFGPTLAGATAYANVDLLLTSGGPLRTGVLNVFGLSTFPFGGSGESFGNFSGSGMNFSVGSLTGSCRITSVSCSANFPFGVRTSIELGGPFLLNMVANLHGGGGDADGSQLSGGWELDVRLFEADGVTPVTIQVVPEPITWVTGALGLTILLALRRRVRP